MSAFGERLRREREMRGISLDEISAHTKIGTRLLRALEEEQFEQLPGGIFNKGYVRAYAKFIGIDEDQMVAEYLESAGENASATQFIPHKNNSGQPGPSHLSETAFTSRATFPIVPALLIIAILAAAAGGWHLYRERMHDRQRPTARTSQVPTPAFPVASDSRQQLSSSDTPQSASAASSATDAPFEVTVRAKDRAWVSLKSDGKVLVRGVIQPTEVKTIHASNQVVFWTGNAGVVELSFNGRNIPLGGGENDERVLVFNSRGVQPPPATQ